MGVVYTYPCYALLPLVYPYANGKHGVVGVCYIASAWGFGVARFDLQGHFLGASERGASDSAGLHVFFMSSLQIGNLRLS